MDSNKYLEEAIMIASTLKQHEHVVYRIGSQAKKPIIVNDSGLDAITRMHPKSYIGALHFRG